MLLVMIPNTIVSIFPVHNFVGQMFLVNGPSFSFHPALCLLKCFFIEHLKYHR